MNRRLMLAGLLGAVALPRLALALGPPASPDQPPGGWTGTGNGGGGSGTANPSRFGRVPPRGRKPSRANERRLFHDIGGSRGGFSRGRDPATAPGGHAYHNEDR